MAKYARERTGVCGSCGTIDDLPLEATDGQWGEEDEVEENEGFGCPEEKEGVGEEGEKLHILQARQDLEYITMRQSIIVVGSMKSIAVYLQGGWGVWVC